MRTLSLPLEDYKKDLADQHAAGFKEAYRRFLLIAEYAKTDKSEAITMIVEDFEGEQAKVDKMLLTLDLMEEAERIWGIKK